MFSKTFRKRLQHAFSSCKKFCSLARRLLKGIIEFLANSCLFVKDVAWTCKMPTRGRLVGGSRSYWDSACGSGWRWNFESMKKAIKTEIMNSFFAVCHVSVSASVCRSVSLADLRRLKRALVGWLGWRDRQWNRPRRVEGESESAVWSVELLGLISMRRNSF